MAPTLEVGSIRTFVEAQEAFLSDLQLRDASIRTYRFGIEAFLRFMQDQYERQLEISEVDVNILGTYNRWLRENYEPATARSYLTSTSRLMEWLDVHDLLPDDAFYDRMARRINGARGRPHVGYKRRPTDPGIVGLQGYFMSIPLPAKGARRLAVLRNRILVPFLYDTAARVSEAMSVSREDVLDGRASRLRLVKTKGDKPRYVFLSEETQQLIRAYCKERTDSPKAPLFLSHGRGKGGALTTAHVWLIIKKAVKEMGLFENTSPHSFRHQRAQDLHDEGMPLDQIQALLGHVSPETTRIVYAPDTDPEMLHDSVETYGKTPSEAAKRFKRSE